MMRGAQHQQGMTTLVTVMVLFFIMALVAAYANRNLIVEQRVAQSYQALGYTTEASHQAVHRLISLLNSDKIDESCEPADDGPGTLRQRLLEFGDSGEIRSPAAGVNALVVEDSPFTVICDRIRPGNWQCQCPLNLQPVAQTDDGEARESMVMRIRPFPGAQGISRVGLSVHACAGHSAGCLDRYQSEFAQVRRVQTLALLRALKMPPVSALVARGTVDLGAGMAVVNNEAGSGGLALHAGGAVQGSMAKIGGPAGSPPGNSLLSSDAALSALDEANFFRRFFGLGFTDYIAQPAMRKLDCGIGGDCSAGLKALIDRGAQLIWHDGDLSLSSEATLGSADLPVLLLVRGRLTINSPVRFFGLVYARDEVSWTNPSANASVIQGALLAGGAVNGDAGATALFDGAILDRLKLRSGSFVPLPGGSWSRKW